MSSLPSTFDGLPCLSSSITFSTACSAGSRSSTVGAIPIRSSIYVLAMGKVLVVDVLHQQRIFGALTACCGARTPGLGTIASSAPGASRAPGRHRPRSLPPGRPNSSNSGRNWGVFSRIYGALGPDRGLLDCQLAAGWRRWRLRQQGQARFFADGPWCIFLHLQYISAFWRFLWCYTGFQTIHDQPAWAHTMPYRDPSTWFL